MLLEIYFKNRKCLNHLAKFYTLIPPIARSHLEILYIYIFEKKEIEVKS